MTGTLLVRKELDVLKLRLVLFIVALRIVQSAASLQVFGCLDLINTISSANVVGFSGALDFIAHINTLEWHEDEGLYHHPR